MLRPVTDKLVFIPGFKLSATYFHERPTIRICQILYAVKSVFHAWTAMRRARDHEETVQGLSLRHFAIGAVIAGIVFVTLVLTVVKLVTR